MKFRMTAVITGLCLAAGTTLAQQPTEKPKPFVPRRLRLEVAERMSYKGEVLTPLDEESVRAALAEAKKQGATAVANAVGFASSSAPYLTCTASSSPGSRDGRLGAASSGTARSVEPPGYASTRTRAGPSAC